MLKNICEQKIKSGICKADCCGVLAISKQLFDRHEYKLKNKKFNIDIGGDHYVIYCDDFSCPFLNRNYKCMIYKERPEVCRKFDSGDPHPYLRCRHRK